MAKLLLDNFGELRNLLWCQVPAALFEYAKSSRIMSSRTAQ